jgi:hypothetical protein
MKIKRSCLLRFLALPLWLAVAAHAFAQAAKVAVIGDPTISDLVDVTTAQLSAIPDLSVLERSDLDKVGREQALKEAITSNDLSSVQFVPADGLVILRAVKQDGKPGVLVRLVAVQPGIVLREVALSDGSDPVAHAKEIVKEFAPYWPKLRQIQKGKISALSLLGLRFEVDGPEAREMERKINLLLAIRLSAEPDTVVLERWRLNDALFEKTLNSQQTSPFWTGSSLIDGSMKWENKEVEVNLRVRPPSGAEVSISDKDSADHLPALVDRLAEKIRAHPMTQASWQPVAEADHYAQLGKWCLDNNLKEEGAEAIESALALGDDSPATHCLQVRAYASLAYTDELPTATSIYIPEAPVVDPASLPDRVKWGTTAADWAGRYLKANPSFSGPPGASEDPVTVSLPVLDNCLRLLRFAYQEGFARDHEAETADLRHSVQNLIAQMEPLLAKRPSDQHDLFLTYEVRYAPYWHETPEATVSYYRDLLNRQTDGALIRREWFESRYFVVRPPCLLPEPEMKAANPDDNMAAEDWGVGSPWIIGWDHQTMPELGAIWDDFQKELNKSSDPVLRADALKFSFTRMHSRDDRNFNIQNTQFEGFLLDNVASIAGPRGNDLLVGFQQNLWAITRGEKTGVADLNTFRSMGWNLLSQSAVLPVEWIKWMPDIYYKVSPEIAKTTLNCLDAYRQWYQTQSPQDPEMITAFEQARRALVVYAGVSAPPPSSGGDFLTVNRHWALNLPMGLEAMRSAIFAPSLITAENKVWFVMFGGKQVHCVDPTNLQADSAFTLPDDLIGNRAYTPGGCCVGVTPQYIVVAIFGKVLLCSRADHTWRKLDLPSSDYRPCWVNQQLYLIYDVQADMIDFRAKGETPTSAVSGLIHVSLPDGGIDNLVSTRRIPPQSSLDGKPLGFPLSLWSSPSGLMLAVDAESPHFQVFGTPAGKNEWVPVTTDPMSCDVKEGTGGELVGKGFDQHGFAQIVLMNGTDNPVLLSNPNRAPATGNQTARWDIPDEIRTTAPDVFWQASAVMRGDDLCLYANVMNATKDDFKTSLYYFAKGQKSGLKIPLKFQSPGSGDPMLARRQPIIFNYQSVHATDYGLVVGQAMGGFWVIPWSDIDAYRAHPGSGSVAASAPPPSDGVKAADAVPVVAPPVAPTPAVPVSAPAPVVLPASIDVSAPMRVAVPTPPSASVAPIPRPPATSSDRD